MASLFDKVTGKASSSPSGNPSKQSKSNKSGNELKKLRRQDLLELLVSQMREADELRETLGERDKTVAELSALVDHLKERLDLKDIQIEHLKERLDEKDAQIERLKKRLDSKDLRITQLETRVLTIAREKGIRSMEELLYMEEQALDRFARQNEYLRDAEPEQEDAEFEPEQEDSAFEEEDAAFEPELAPEQEEPTPAPESDNTESQLQDEPQDTRDDES